MTINATPPPRLPQVLILLKKTYTDWNKIHKNFAKVERFGIGTKVEETFLDILETTFSLSYLSKEHKIPFLTKAIRKVDVLKFFMQITWENKLISSEQYSEMIKQIEEIGRQLGGWKKGLKK